MGNPVVHWEFWSKDPAKASSFYSNVFGWKMEHYAEMDYQIVQTRKENEIGIDGGISKQNDAHPGNMTDPDGRVSGLWKVAM